uniref:Uncharacterized protein n=1 Tax=Cannabis sativa TaxID=3483 RepID=A0A803P3F9_CANSA
MDVRVVREFLDVFPEELPGLSPQQEIDFIIDLAHGAESVSKASYSSGKLKKLKLQVQRILDLGFSQPSVSP